MKAFWIAPFLLLTSVKAQEIPPLAPLRGDAANLVDTMTFIQEKLPGTVNYMLYIHNNIVGTDYPPKKGSFALTQVSTDAGRCSISFHFRSEIENNHMEKDGEILLKQVKEISLMQKETLQNQSNAKAGHPEFNAKIDPAVTILLVKSAPNFTAAFNFYDESLAERVSLALKHAVSLCGGGKPETF